MRETSSTGKMEFTLRDDDINTMLHYALESMEEDAKSFVPSAYLDVTKDRYNFYINLQTPFFPYFKTRICLATEVKELTGTKKGFEFKFVDAKIGRISGLLNAADSAISEDTIKEAFTGTKMSFDVDWPNHSIKYYYSNLLSDFSLASNGDDIVSLLIKEIFSDTNDTFTTDFHSKNGINLAIDFSSAHDNSFVPITTFANTITTLREENVDKETVDENALKDCFVEVATANGEMPVSGKEIQEYLDNHKDESTQTTYITESELNSCIRGTGLVGKVFPFVGKDLKTDKNDINFITVNDFCADLKNNNVVDFYINLNINGY